jgi:hypothetical protein
MKLLWAMLASCDLLLDVVLAAGGAKIVPVWSNAACGCARAIATPKPCTCWRASSVLARWTTPRSATSWPDQAAARRLATGRRIRGFARQFDDGLLRRAGAQRVPGLRIGCARRIAVTPELLLRLATHFANAVGPSAASAPTCCSTWRRAPRAAPATKRARRCAPSAAERQLAERASRGVAAPPMRTALLRRPVRGRSAPLPTSATAVEPKPNWPISSPACTWPRGLGDRRAADVVGADHDDGRRRAVRQRQRNTWRLLRANRLGMQRTAGGLTGNSVPGRSPARSMDLGRERRVHAVVVARGEVDRGLAAAGRACGERRGSPSRSASS